MYTRREMARWALAVPAAAFGAGRIDSRIRGVMIGAQSYSFRQLPEVSLDAALKAYQEAGLGYCELWSGHLEPRDRERAAAWRKAPPLEEIRNLRGKFDAAGVTLWALNYGFREDFSDAEIENGFRVAQALGATRITASSNVSTAKRIDPFAQKYKITVGMHNHSAIKDNEFARPEDFAEAMKGRSKYIAVNLDIGHFTAAGYDPVQYLLDHHDRIVTLHIKDRRKNQGANVPFGEGDTDIKGVLNVLKTKGWPIPAMIEYEYKGTADPVTEVRNCYSWMRRALES